ncbi:MULTISPECIES: DUF397 domain-containing protein [Streptomyces]|uniref:DUF397 domain-containing protein n=1 Tax=Streptomyces sp. H-KF8 TaxID=1727216 RepID=UPI0007ED5593|nr:DUF397 domain-containing protein [Streptomyces sp. H-KF8]OBQ48308.1 DUF397 domain-containing protein [Streptomyces sp. H-KF8]
MADWRRSSYSGPDDGNECAEIANSPSRVAVRDSKAPTRATLTFRTTAYVPFLEALKESAREL